MQFTVDIILIVLVLGFSIGVLSSLSGIGGGVMYVPLITLIFLRPINIAVGTSTFIILISSGAGFVMHLKNKATNLRLALLFSFFSIMGSLICTILFQILFPINNDILKIIFAVVLIIMGFILLNRARKGIKYKDDNDQNILIEKRFGDFNKTDLKKGIPLFLFGGFLVNLLGIGGGVVYVPALHMIMLFSIHQSVALSTSIIFFTTAFNTVIKSILGVVDFLLGLIIAIGSVFGSIIGAKYLKKIPKFTLQVFIALMLVVLSIIMLF
ncbi:MAG: sulfite exporter TauE/SafE family protein [Candidatus Lokiarchaeota archaeon]|nr:sulfite exporter TauE/SafE family protein [Candidatus Lokiarchaeota archaeon]